MNTFRTLLAALVATASCLASPARSHMLTSPDKSLSASLDDSRGYVTIAINREGRQLLAPSPIAINVAGLKDATAIRSAKAGKTQSAAITAPFWRNGSYSESWNPMEIKLDNGAAIELRAYNNGIAWRHRLPGGKDSVTIAGETLSLQFPADPMAWLSYTTNDSRPMAMAFQNIYTAAPLSQANDRLAFLPATIDDGDGVKLTVLESDLDSYPGLWLRPDSTARSLNAEFAPLPSEFDYYPWRRQRYVTASRPYIARVAPGHNLPWRIIAVSADDTEMPVNNLVYSLAEPSRVDDTSWIRPGKVAWDWWNDWGLTGVSFKAGINTDTYKHYIDFAADNGIEYVVLDEGWYAPASGDMLSVIPEIDLPALIDHGRSRGVDLVLWTVFNVLDDQLEEACAKYSAMGIKGFKVDFLDRDDAEAVDMTRRIADACARHHLFLDYHGIYKPVGLNRTYPNLLNYEAVFGMEEVKWTDIENNMPLYDVTFPFIRMMAGQVDYTPGAMNNASRSDWKAIYSKPMSMGTRAHQMAAYIVHDSPFTMLCDAPSNYRGEEQCVGFITSLPTVFDESKVISGRLGEHIVTARRKDGSWFVGGMTDWTPRDVEIDFSFLPEGMDYKATMIVDGVNADHQGKDYAILTDTVSHGSRLTVHMASGGGVAMRIDPLAPAHGPVTDVPAAMRDRIDPFFGKYIESDGFYVVASPRVSDEALGLACDIVGHMLLKRPDVKQEMTQRGAHLLIIGKDEATCDIPEYKHVCTDDPDSIAYINWRARGFGGAPEDDLSSGCGEENLLALPTDKYVGENILIHEFAHLIHTIGILGVEPGFQQRLEAQWQNARDNGLWEGTYAISCPEEYFAECVQSFFNCNRYSAEPNGVHNHVNRRHKLKAYDPGMYDLLSEYFYEIDIPILNQIHP